MNFVCFDMLVCYCVWLRVSLCIACIVCRLAVLFWCYVFEMIVCLCRRDVQSVVCVHRAMCALHVHASCVCVKLCVCVTCATLVRCLALCVTCACVVSHVFLCNVLRCVWHVHALHVSLVLCLATHPWMQLALYRQLQSGSGHCGQCHADECSPKMLALRCHPRHKQKQCIEILHSSK